VGKDRAPGSRWVFANGTGRTGTRGGSEVVELEHGITVYPAREEKGRWRAVWYEDGERQQCEASSEEKLAARPEKVTERLAADAPNMKRPGADLIRHCLDPDRLPFDERWSRKHEHTQRRLCERFAAPVIDAVTCEDIKTSHMQKIVNAASTPGEGARVQGMISALVSVGLDGGYLANPRLAKVHWQAGGRDLPAPKVSVAGESVLWIDPAEVPADDDVARLGRALAAGQLAPAQPAVSGGAGHQFVPLAVPACAERARELADVLVGRDLELHQYGYVRAGAGGGTGPRPAPAVGEAVASSAATSAVRSSPRPDSSSRIVSPRVSGPTPAGVPVVITSPG
jgi:hypothetical protein